MSREHYELLELLQNVDDQMIYEAGQPWKAKKKRFYAPAGGACAACIALAVCLGVFGGFGERAVAAIREFTTRISEIIVNEKDLQPYTEVINQTQTKDGISVTLDEVVLDSHRILATVEAVSDTPVVIDKRGVSNQWPSLVSVKMNGEDMECIMNSQYMTDQSGQYVLEYSFENGEIPQELSEVELLINYGMTNEEGMWESRADFIYSFAVTKQELMQQSVTLPIDADITAGDGLVFHMEELTYTDASGRMNIICNKEPGTWTEEEGYRYYSLPYYYSLDLEDDQGNCLSFDVLENSYNKETRELTCESFIGTPPAENTAYLDISLVRFKPVFVTEEDSGAEPEEERVGEIRVEMMQQQKE